MKFKVNGNEYEFDEESVTFGEARMLERVTGMTMSELGDKGEGGSVEAMQAFIWLAVRREDPIVQFSDLDEWSIADLEIDDEDEADENAEGSDDPFEETPAQ